MRIPLPKTAVRTLSYTIIFLSALYFVSPSLLSEEVPEKKDAVTVPKEGEKKDGEKPASTENPAKKVEEKTVKPPKKSPGLVDLFLNGGWSMWPLALASIIALGVAFERIFFFFTTKLASGGYNQDLADSIEKDGLPGAQKFLTEHKDQRISDVLVNGLEVANEDPELFAKGVEREAGEVMTLLERGLTILASVSTIAPLIGFLGTVSGMINAFDAIANADQVNAKVVAGGIKESLITTAAGLIVAIPAMSFFQFLSGKVNSFAADVEEAANRIYKELLKLKGKKSA